MQWIFLLATLSVASAHGQPTCGCNTATNRMVLQDFFAATRGPQWYNNSGWLLATPVCDWFGISCGSGPNGSITGIELPGNNLTGTLPDTLSLLTTLQTLDVVGNQLTGTLPASWSALTSLTAFYAYDNQLTGSLPPSWASWTQMATLYLNDNALSGTLPSSWSALRSLVDLVLIYNMLSGLLPDSWSAIGGGDLQMLSLGNNQFSGPLPTSWTQLTNVAVLDVSNNQLSGCLDICLFSPNTALHAHNNSFSGGFNFSCFPDPTENCSMLQVAVLSGNHFCGAYCGLPTCGNSSCAAYPGTYANGPTIGFAEVASETGCCAACHDRQQCVAAEWYPATGVCIFKSAAGGTTKTTENVTLLLITTC